MNVLPVTSVPPCLCGEISAPSSVPIRAHPWSKWLACLALLTAAPLAHATVPDLVHHQGRVSISGIPFDGTASFKFALVSADGSTTHWSHDGSSVAGSAPATALALPVSRGLYSLALGDTSIPGMDALPASAFAHPDVRLRVWFDDGVNGSQLLSPDQALASAPYALHAGQAATLTDGGAGLTTLSLSALRGAPSQPVVAWGNNDHAALVAPAFATTVVQVAAGQGHNLARLADGSVLAWGLATSGQTTVPPAAVPAAAIAAGFEHSLAITSAGAVVAWGRNDSGQATVPLLPLSATAVAGGERHSLALLADGTVRAWGDNTHGQTNVPPGLTNVIAIAAGADHSLALRADGSVVAWGRDETDQSTVPPTLPPATAIAAGAFHSLALLADGTVAAWGWNTAGQCDVPATLANVTALDAGYAHSVAVTTGGTLVAWGDNTVKQLSFPVTLTDVVTVSTQGGHTLALRAASVTVPLARLDRDNTFQGRLGVGRAPAKNTLEVEGQASKTTASGWVANSDARIKTDIRPIPSALDLLANIRPVTFRYTPDYLAAHPSVPDERYYNVIAQEFARAFPDAVTESGETLPDGTPILQVDTYPALITALAAIQELEAKNAALEKRLEALEQRAARDVR